MAEDCEVVEGCDLLQSSYTDAIPPKRLPPNLGSGGARVESRREIHKEFPVSGQTGI